MKVTTVFTQIAAVGLFACSVMASNVEVGAVSRAGHGSAGGDCYKRVCS